jgi:hypothetical protein
MMPGSSYPRFCPVAMAASLLEPRWTMLLCEMWSGSTRFNQLDLARTYADRIIGLKSGRVAVDAAPAAVPDAALAALYDGGRPDETEEVDLAEPHVSRRAAAL